MSYTRKTRLPSFTVNICVLLIVFSTASGSGRLKRRTATLLSNTSFKFVNPSTFLGACASPNRTLFCPSYACYARRSLDLDLRQLDRMVCETTAACVPKVSAMSCVSYGQGEGSSIGFCECARGSAYNATSCRCEEAEPCHYGEQGHKCFSGMACADDRCSCDSLESTLFDAQSRACVLPRTSPPEAFEDGQTSHGAAFAAVVAVLGCLVGLAVVAIAAYVFTEGFTCNKGDYACEEKEGNVVVADSGDQRHVAAWDLPSLDYLSEEQTMKYLKERHGGVPARTEQNTHELSEYSSPTPSSGGGGSLPESEQPAGESNDSEHVNRGFVHDDQGGLQQQAVVSVHSMEV